MTATDELRRLLDGRGVEWKNETAFMQGQEHLMTTWRSADDKTVAYSEFKYPQMRKLRIYDCTPAQAVEATLGSDLKAENAKLRELVRDMWRELAMACAEQVVSHEALRKVSDRMRELEVDA